jgi:hypothetical protein
MQFLLSRITHSQSVHHPPSFNNHYKTCRFPFLIFPTITQNGTAVLVSVSVSVWNLQYGNSGLVGVQIRTAVLVRVRVSICN